MAEAPKERCGPRGRGRFEGRRAACGAITGGSPPRQVRRADVLRKSRNARQYIGARDNLILNLDGLAKNIKGIGKGKAWLIATAQQTLTEDDPRHPSRDPRYASLDPRELPLTESLKQTVARFLPYWHATIVPAIKSGERVLIAAHGNSLRALVMYLDGLSESAVVELNIPTGIPLVYELDDDLTPIKHFYLGDPEAAAAAARRVAAQTATKT